jgi:hypothetical protein
MLDSKAGYGDEPIVTIEKLLVDVDVFSFAELLVEHHVLEDVPAIQAIVTRDRRRCGSSYRDQPELVVEISDIAIRNRGTADDVVLFEAR